MDRERDRREHEVVQPDDGGERERRSNREREAAIPPGCDEERTADQERRRAPDRVGRPCLHQQPEHRVAVLVERATEMKKGPDVRLEAGVREDEQERGADDGGCKEHVARSAGRGEPDDQRPQEELDARRKADCEAQGTTRVARAPGDRSAERQNGRQVRHAHLAEGLGPEAHRAVDPPIANAHEPDREREDRQAEDRHHDVGRPRRKHRQRRNDKRSERRPDEVRSGERVPPRVGERVHPVEQELRLRVEFVLEVERERVVASPDDEHPDDGGDGQRAEGDKGAYACESRLHHLPPRQEGRPPLGSADADRRLMRSRAPDRPCDARP